MAKRVFCDFCGREMRLSRKKLEGHFYDFATGRPKVTIGGKELELSEVIGKLECPSLFCRLVHLTGLYCRFDYYQLQNGEITREYQGD